MKKTFSILIVLIFIWLLIITIFVVNRHEKTNINEISEYDVSGFSTDLSKVFDQNKSSVVIIEQANDISSGFIYTKRDGNVYIVTTYHSISETGSINIHFNSGLVTKGNIKAYDIYLDLALIECPLEYEIKEVKLGNSSLLKSGEFVLSIGTNNLDYDYSSQFGMISSNYQEINNNILVDGYYHNYYLSVIELSNEFKKGYSGAPIFNMQGETIGMITMKDDDVTFALPINDLKYVVDKMLNGENYERIVLGIKGKFLNDLEKYEINQLNVAVDIANGYYIEDIHNYSLAAHLGVNKGDIIVSINNVPIKNHDDILTIIYNDYQEFEFNIIRNNETMILKGNIDD